MQWKETQRSVLTLQPILGTWLEKTEESAIQKNQETTKIDKVIPLIYQEAFQFAVIPFFAWFPWSAAFHIIGAASFKWLLYSTVYWNVMERMPMVTHGGNISSVCHLSPMICCGKPQTPQRDVAIQREPHCRHWKCERKETPLAEMHTSMCFLLFLPHWGGKKKKNLALM